VETDRNFEPGDDADRASYYVESVIDDHVKEAMRRAAEIPVGKAGECQSCGEESLRLVDDTCAKCRDLYARYYAP
jgi:hypothetical protein